MGIAGRNISYLGFYSLGVVLWQIGQHQLQRPEHSQDALGGAVQVSADVVVQLVQRDLRVSARDAHLPAQVLDGLQAAQRSQILFILISDTD